MQEIGLQKDVSEELFLEFCTIVAEVASRFSSDQLNAKRSKILVEYLFEAERSKVEHLFDNHLRGPEFLSAVSTIKFVASEKVDADLATIHQQYQCEEDEPLPFIQFRDSIPWSYKNIVWTSAPLLPSWVQPNQIFQSLGVLQEPTYNMVIDHLQNISFALVEMSCNLPPSVENIMKLIYSFLAAHLECISKEATDECTNDCKEIGRRLKTVPCILVNEGNVLVMGKQLSFKLPDGDPLSPFLYKVPREYGTLEHFLKRLGVTEMIKLSQLANVFKIMKDQCNEEQLSSDYEKKAKYAMYMLFELVVKTRVESLDELYLPSEEKRLVKSNQLVCKVPPRLSEVAKSHYQVLLKLEKCKLNRIPENDYIDALQEELRPVKLESLVREEIDPTCTNSTCPHAGHDLICDFQQRYANLLSSEEFLKGVERLIKHQKSSSLSHEDTNRLECLRSPQVQIKCIGIQSIKIRLIDRNTQEVLEGLEDICYVVKENRSWSLYMQHGMLSLGMLFKCVNRYAVVFFT